MKYQFYLGHPAHFHLLKNVIINLRDKGHEVFVLIKKKEILEDLINNTSISYKNILAEGRKDTMLGIAIGVLKRDFRTLRYVRKNKPDLLIGTSIENSHVTKLTGIPSITLQEDDAAIIPLHAKIAYPWATEIVTPDVCDNGKWNNRSIKYSGYHELAYLHPNNFIPDKSIVQKYFSINRPYFILRFVKLKAHHDEGIKGLDYQIAKKIIDFLKLHGDVYITSERELENEFEKYRISINPIDMHHILAYAKLCIGDSQTMAAEAGVLGVPFIRFNDFVGKIGYLNDLELNYQLGFGFKPRQEAEMFEKITELIATPKLSDIFQERRKKMLAEKIDTTKFLTWLAENYPESARIMKENPAYQYNFK